MPLQKDLACQTTGLEWTLKAMWTKCGATWCPYYPLTGKQEVTFGFKSLSSTPKEIVLKVCFNNYTLFMCYRSLDCNTCMFNQSFDVYDNYAFVSVAGRPVISHIFILYFIYNYKCNMQYSLDMNRSRNSPRTGSKSRKSKKLDH